MLEGKSRSQILLAGNLKEIFERQWSRKNSYVMIYIMLHL